MQFAGKVGNVLRNNTGLRRWAWPTILVGMALVFVFRLVTTMQDAGRRPETFISIGEFADLIEDPQTRQTIESIVVGPGDEVRAYAVGAIYRTDKDPDSSLPSQLRSLVVPDAVIREIRPLISVENAITPPWLTILTTVAPLVFIMALVWWGLSRRGINSQIDNLKKVPTIEQTAFQSITFAEVAGLDAAKHELAGIVHLLRDPEKSKRGGARLPAGVLLVGAPGTGKSLLAKAIAGETKATLILSNGADFIEMFIGIGPKRITDLFEKARKADPSVIVIDNIDAFAFKRGEDKGMGQDERFLTFSQLLAELDKHDKNQRVLLVATTNRLDMLDPALLRPGRLERVIQLELPDLAARENLLRLLASGKPLANDVDVKALAGLTDGMTGAALEQLVNEAALLAVGESRPQITRSDFDNALAAMIASRRST